MCEPANFKGLNFTHLTKTCLLVDDDAGRGAMAHREIFSSNGGRFFLKEE